MTRDDELNPLCQHCASSITHEPVYRSNPRWLAGFVCGSCGQFFPVYMDPV